MKEMGRRVFSLVVAITLTLSLLVGCSDGKNKQISSTEELSNHQSEATTTLDESHNATTTEPPTTTEPATITELMTTEKTSVDKETEEESTSYIEPDRESKIIVIDAGHQAKANKEKEPDGPGSTTMKAKVSSGTRGCVTGIYEYEMNLDIALMLQKELESRGYTVIMTRSTHDVNISNSERAAIANEANADAFIRIHADGVDDSTRQGAFTICQTKSNIYNGSIYEECRLLSECVLDGMVASMGCKRRSIWETDTMSGINWCQVPVTIIEMGYMSNPEEDELMATAEYRRKIVQGIANGIDKYIEKRK